MPGDKFINLNKVQPLPIDWKSKKSPVYTQEQIDSAQYTAMQALSDLRLELTDESPRVAKRLNDQSNHLLRTMENNIIASFDTTDKVKDVYSTTMVWMQS